jgi:hypothetical protein
MTVSSVQLAGGGTAKNVLYVSSANLDFYPAYESALTISHAGLYEEYLKYFNDLMRYGSKGKVNNNYGKDIKAGAHRLYTFPRKEAGKKSNPTSASNDPIVEILKNTTCAPSRRTEISLANFRIQRQAVVNELIAARKRGCRVRVVTGVGELKAVKALARAMPVRICDGTVHMHEKFMLIRRGSETTVYAGSHNLTYRALRQNDENILALRNHAVYGPYDDRFNYLHNVVCKPLKPSSNVAPTVTVNDDEDIA